MFEAFHHHFSPGHGSLGPLPPHPQPRCFTMHPLSSCRPAPCGSSGRSGRGTLRGSGSPVRAAVSTSISSPCWKIGTSLVGKTKPVVYHEPHGAGSWLSKLDRYDRFPRRERKKSVVQKIVAPGVLTLVLNAKLLLWGVPQLWPPGTRNPLGRCCHPAGKSSASSEDRR